MNEEALTARYATAIGQLLPRGRFFGQLQGLKKVLFLTIAREFARYQLQLENLQKGTLLENDFLLAEYQTFLQRNYSLALLRGIFSQRLPFSQASLQVVVGSYYENFAIKVGVQRLMHCQAACNTNLGYRQNERFIAISASGLKKGKTKAELKRVLGDLAHAYASLTLNGETI